ncbi:hypothetical protein RvY_01255 [Ramazzottius varieornatus]|uniref:RHD domain-containing protein n=1 Tax=Ramazzottius varieornatus TaxID=947166 RepID=A0A1D1UMS9_RAMVA|nr:hypothetical protein RvY_01255 [Ramazzottius varieornatus]
MSTSMEELLQHFQQQRQESLNISNISCSMAHAVAPTTLSDVLPPSSPASQQQQQLFLVGNLAQTQRPRLATWTFSPADSGYAESVASPGTCSLPGCKKRFSASLDDISDSSGSGNKIHRQESIAEIEGSDLENSFFRLDFSQEYPSRTGCTELLILRQPEAQHRPRYETEGSRGRIKDRSGSMCPAVQLRNFHGQSAVLQVYVAVERGLPKPHPLFRVCKVNSKRTAPAILRSQPEDNCTILEIPFSAKDDWTIDIDCCSLVKLRNSDCDALKKASGSASALSDGKVDPSKRPKRMGCPKVRLGFRAILTMLDGSILVLQTTSSTISCSSTLGVPEVHFVSHKSCPASGGLDIVVIGRGFVRNESHLFVIERDQDDNTLWEAELDIAWDKFNQVHLVGTLPAYRDPSVSHPVLVYLSVRNNDGKKSDLQPLIYTPVDSVEIAHTVTVVTREEPVKELSHSSVKIDPYPIQPKSPDSPVLIASQPPVGVLADGNIHYLIQLPGTAQPIIITVPQPNNVVTQELPQFAVETVSPAVEQKPFPLPQSPTSYDQPVLESHVCPAEETCSVVAERSNYINSTESGLPSGSDGGKEDCENAASQLDQLLREIFGFDILPEAYPQVLAGAAQQQQDNQQHQQCYQAYDMDLGNAEAWLMEVEQENSAGYADYESSGRQ